MFYTLFIQIFKIQLKSNNFFSDFKEGKNDKSQFYVLFRKLFPPSPPYPLSYRIFFHEILLFDVTHIVSTRIYIYNICLYTSILNSLDFLIHKSNGRHLINPCFTHLSDRRFPQNTKFLFQSKISLYYFINIYKFYISLGK